MAQRIVASRPDPAIVTVPWSTPLEEWTDDHVVPLPRGLGGLGGLGGQPDSPTLGQASPG